MSPMARRGMESVIHSVDYLYAVCVRYMGSRVMVGLIAYAQRV